MAKSKKKTRSEAKEKLDKDEKNKSSDPKGQSKWQEYLRKYSPSKNEKKSH